MEEGSLGLLFVLFWFCLLVCFWFCIALVSVALQPVLELALIDQASLELTEIRPPLPPKCWD